jgi:hypothetical protein
MPAIINPIPIMPRARRIIFFIPSPSYATGVLIMIISVAMIVKHLYRKQKEIK